MKDQRSERTNQPSPECQDTVESPMKQGQVEQVVCSADCRSVERTDPLHRQNHQQITEIADGAAGTAPSESAEPTPSVEDRISVALARRGDIPAATFIEGAVFSDWISRKSSESATHALSHFLDLNDDEFASALERHADALEAILGGVL